MLSSLEATQEGLQAQRTSYDVQVQVSAPGVAVTPLLKGCSESVVFIHLLLFHHLTKNTQAVRNAVPSAIHGAVPGLAGNQGSAQLTAMAGCMAMRDGESPWKILRDLTPAPSCSLSLWIEGMPAVGC